MQRGVVKGLKTVLVVGCILVGGPGYLIAQQDADVISAQQAYDALNFRAVIPAAQRALAKPSLSVADRIVAWELLGFTYGALDSTAQAVTAFRNLIFLDPDREPDAVRVTPRITSLYASALGQVLVVRNVRIDSTTFVAGSGRMNVRFSLTRPGGVVLRIQGSGASERVDSTAVVDGEGVLDWDVVDQDSLTASPGTYEAVLDAQFGADRYSARRRFEVRHSRVDTTAHLTSLPNREPLPEMVQPGRNWRPLGLATLYTVLASGAALALENTTLGRPARREIGGVAFVAITTGFVMSLKRPDSVSVPNNILYNQLLREELARQNAEIATQNEIRRSQTRITIVPIRGDGS